MDERTCFLLRICAASAAMSSAGCSVGDVSDLFSFRKAVVTDDLSIRLVDGRSFRGDAAVVEVTPALPKGPDASASITLSTADRRGYGLSVALDVDLDTLLQRDFSAPLADGQGGGTLAYLSSEGARIIGPGTISLRLSSGKLSGKLETSDEAFSSATIEGRYEVVCLVLPEMLGSAPDGQTSEGTWILVQDEAKTSKFCQPFADL